MSIDFEAPGFMSRFNPIRCLARSDIRLANHAENLSSPMVGQQMDSFHLLWEIYVTPNKQAKT